MSYYFYISPSDFETASKNGISPDTLIHRVRLRGWERERAINEPCRKKTDLSKWSKVANKNGISYGTLQRRIERGWTPEMAATTPLIDHGKQIAQVQIDNRIYPQKYVDRARQNGIRYATFTWRMRQGWTMEEASETKTSARGSGQGKLASPWSKEKRMVGMKV